MQEYDRFLDENDWDLYYWATQEPTPTSRETAEGAQPELATDAVKGQPPPANEATASNENQEIKREPAKGEWQQTAGNYKPAYRPVPSRWQSSEILAMVRQHVLDRSAAGVSGESSAKVGGQNLAQSVQTTGGGGLGMMPNLPNFERKESR